MSYRGGRGGRGGDKGSRGGYSGGRGGGNNANAASSAPPPSIDESPVRQGAVGSNVAMTSSANSNNNNNTNHSSNKGGSNTSKGARRNSNAPSSAANNNNNTNNTTSHHHGTAAAPDPVGPKGISPLSADAICRTQTPTAVHRGGDAAATGGEQRDLSTSYERPPMVPQQQQQQQQQHRSSFEVTATPNGGAKQQASMSSNNGLLSANNNTSSSSNNGGGWSVQQGPSSASGAAQSGAPSLGLSNAPVDREVFVAARAAVHNAPRPVLAAILTSLLDDHPALAPIVKLRYERAMTAVATQQQMAQQQIPPAGGFWNGVGPQQQIGAAVCSSGSNSPARKRSFRGRGGHEEEQQMCGVHGAVRSTKHLRLADNGMFECVPGFHCLETSKDNSNCVSPVKGERELSHGLHVSAGPYVPHRASFSSPPTPPPGTLDQPYVVQGLFQPSGGNSTNAMTAMNGNGMMNMRQNTQPPLMSAGPSIMGSSGQGAGMMQPMPQMTAATANLLMGTGNGHHSQQQHRPMSGVSSASASMLGGSMMGNASGVHPSHTMASPTGHGQGGADDDNLEDLLKSLHLASGQAF